MDDDNSMTPLTNFESDKTDRMSGEDEDISSASETFDDSSLLMSTMEDDMTAQLAAAGWQYKHYINNGDLYFFALQETFTFRSRIVLSISFSRF